MRLMTIILSPTASARMYNKDSKYWELEKSLKDIEKVLSIYKEYGEVHWKKEYDMRVKRSRSCSTTC